MRADKCAGAVERAPSGFQIRVPQMPRMNHVRPYLQRHGDVRGTRGGGKARCILVACTGRNIAFELSLRNRADILAEALGRTGAEALEANLQFA